MRKRTQLRPKLTYANVMVTILAFIVLGGGAFAATKLPKNSVGTKQLKKNSVTKAKIKKNSINGSKVKNNSLTGADIKLSKLGTVPSAKSAAGANSADTASVANSLSPSEGWHQIGAPGEPGFENGWSNVPTEGPVSFEPAGFYKDHEGIVHLKGLVRNGTSSAIFHLPPGYRPANGKVIVRLTLCSGGECPAANVGTMFIAGSGIPVPGFDGVVTVPGGAGSSASLEGITFRAEG